MATVAAFDSSCYTTSFAVVRQGRVLVDKRIMLDVSLGGLGLRQSDAVFKHIQNYKTIMQDISGFEIDAVAAANAPRSVDGSYMPVFNVGTTIGTAMSSGANVPYYEFSHQEGHIMAGLYSANALHLKNREFIALHLSGGTTEVLHVNQGRCNIIGGTIDISAGQLIDRVGVMLGLEFPCGARLESLADGAAAKIKIPVNVNGLEVNFSGAETKLLHQVKDTDEHIAEAALRCIALSIEKIIENAIKQTGCTNVLLVGGVAANKQLRRLIGSRAYFASPELSRDNAVGIALLGEEASGL